MTESDRCIAHLTAGGLVLTPDLRQARIWRRLHDQAQIAAGREVWPSAQVLPLDAWLLAEWREASASRPELPEPLSPAALAWLWRRQAAKDTPGLVDPADIGARARASWLQLRAHGGRIEDLSRWPLTRDQQSFVAWSRAAQAELRERQACDPGELAALMIANGVLPAAGPPLLLAGFHRLTPVARALCEALASAGRAVAQQLPDHHAASPYSHEANDADRELSAALAWLRARVQEHPGGIHALILPGLAERRGGVERALEAALQPDLELPTASRHERCFDLAGGDALRLRPVAETALMALDCALGRVDWPMVSRLLRSTCLAMAGGEAAARIRLDLALRDARSLPRADLAIVQSRADASEARDFAARLRAASAAVRGPARRGAGAWAQVFGASLAAWGWPGKVPADSGEYQAARRLREMLDELAALQSIAPPLAAAEALEELRRFAAAPFQPESGEPAIFVLDALEDPGVPFDSLWVAGLTAAAWPPAVSVDPWLPIEAQRTLGMPRVTPADCVNEASEVMTRWRTRAGALVLSWPGFENDTDVDPSPLIPAGLPQLPVVPQVTIWSERMRGSTPLEALGQDAAPALDRPRAQGGARALELQSQCPFRAFAELRLAARPLEEFEPGIDRRLRGVLLHRALHQFWSALGSQRALLQLDDAALKAEIERAVAGALAHCLAPDTGERSRKLEAEWLRLAIRRLAALDAARPEFVVAETEREFDGEIGGLELRLRVDRVDRVGESLVVLDYKTGKASDSQWRGARMDAPQLPLYAALHPGRPAGVAFAVVKAGQARHVGIASDPKLMDGLKSAARFRLTEGRETGFEWRQITERWWAWLKRLAEDHAAGSAVVDPKQGATTCRRCHLSALCRVAGVDDEADEDAEHAD